ncbi:hypothetical protein SteCoe_36560 [Stentor coeruleus]|uniref:RBR-type E3 ubiquitin transferase n=1 Tax=Stentor coeruleus TaxID=5963 RepID=A0A1R2APV1_9CILI|nr:hypothetical protein SteCoe_36560 [Stentor coeruleus]
MEEKCCLCQEVSDITLKCQHKYCNECLLKLAKTILEENSDQPIKCEKCQIDVDKQILYNLFGGVNNYTYYVADQLKIVCQLCLSLKKSSNFVFLSCSHMFCILCFREYFFYKLDSCDFEAEGILCPECGETLSENFIECNFTSEILKNYKEILNKKYKLLKFKNKIFRWCKYCDSCNDFEDGETTITCITCKKVFCVRCKNDPHPFLNCDYIDEEKDIQRMINAQSSNDCINFFIDENTSKCPSCKNAVIKEKGCNFIRCPWEGCKVLFCTLCNNILTVILI